MLGIPAKKKKTEITTVYFHLSTAPAPMGSMSPGRYACSLASGCSCQLGEQALLIDLIGRIIS